MLVSLIPSDVLENPPQQIQTKPLSPRIYLI